MCNRYPSDTIDRFWWRFANAEDNVDGTNETVTVKGSVDLVPEVVMQTNYQGDGYSFNISSRPISTAVALSGSHRYYVGLWFVQFTDLQQAGLLKFNVTINGILFSAGVDLFTLSNPIYTAAEIFSPTDESLGPYSDSIIIKALRQLGTLKVPTLAAGEVLQLFDDAMNATAPTSSYDGTSFQSKYLSFTLHIDIFHATQQ